MTARVPLNDFSMLLQVLLLVGLVVGCLCWRRRTKRRAIQAQEFQAATYFSNSECVLSSCGDDIADVYTLYQLRLTMMFHTPFEAPLAYFCS